MVLRNMSVPSEVDIMNRPSTEESTLVPAEFEVSERHGAFCHCHTVKAAFDFLCLCFGGPTMQQ